MSPEAIHSLIKLFGVEKGIHILNMFTAMDDLELSQLYRRFRPQRSGSADGSRLAQAGSAVSDTEQAEVSLGVR